MFPKNKEIVSYFVDNKISSSKVKDIARALHISPSNYSAFRRHLKGLVQLGLLDRSGKYYYVKQDEKGFSGILRVTKGRFGFVSVSGSDTDFFIPSDELSDGLDGDFVRINKIGGFSRDGLPRASVIQIIETARRGFIGLLHNQNDSWKVQVEGTNLGRDIFVSPVNGQLFTHGYRVEVEITDRASGYSGLKGVVTKIIGDPEDPLNDYDRITHEFGLNSSFSNHVVKDLDSRFKVFTDEILRRTDYRDQRCFTVDPDEAKDFDDAVYIESLDNKGYRLWVHIADVSFFVPEGSELDSEVRLRGTSVYLIDRVIHMLPSELASDYCSLVPGADRLAVSVQIDLNSLGEINGFSVKESVIQSSGRLTYSNVQAIIDQNTDNNSTAEDFRNQIDLLSDLFRKRKNIRRERGALDLEVPECKIVLNDEGKPIEIGCHQVLESNGLIEECMLMANECIGQFCSKNNLPVLYRVHAPPSNSKLENLKHIYSLLGFGAASSKKRVDITDLQKLILKTQNTDYDGLVSKLVLRSLSRAEYTPDDIGHFGLSQNCYVHFTSPIRRFPDLQVHRVVKKKISKRKFGLTDRRECEDLEDLNELGRYLSGRERRAESASRAYLRIKALRYLNEFVGETFFGIVSGVLKSGIFVEIENMFVDGYVSLNSMNDSFQLDRARFRLVGRRSRQVIQLGARIKVRIVAVDYHSLEMDLEYICQGDKSGKVHALKLNRSNKSKRKIKGRRPKNRR